MQFINLAAQYDRLKSDIHSRINAVLEHGQYIQGPEVKLVEEKLAAYAGVKHCISVANGTDALLIAMMALGIQPGDEVITTPFTFIANAEMIALLRAVPVFVDIDPLTYNIDADQIEAAISDKTCCIMPVSLYGQCADMDRINAIADQHGIPVIEDAAQSFGALYRGKKSCALSTIGCTSFFPSKPLGCYGDGGACFTDDDALAVLMKQIRVHGQDKRYSHRIQGVNSRLDTLQAAILLAKLTVFDSEVNSRQRLGRQYDALLKKSVKTIQVAEERTCVYAQYTVEVPDRAAVQTFLQEKNIPTAVHYPLILNQQPAFSDHPQRQQSFPAAEYAASRVISLPMHPYLSDKDQSFIVDTFLAALELCQETV